MNHPAAGRARLWPVLIDARASGPRGTALAGGWLRFAELGVETPTGVQTLPAAAVAALHPEAAATLARLTRSRPALGRLALDRPSVVALAPAGPSARAPAPPTVAIAPAEGDPPEAVAAVAPDWSALRAAAPGPACAWIAPSPPQPLDGPGAVADLFDRAAAALEGADAAAVPRGAVILDLGCPEPAALGALAVLHGLGTPLMLDAGAGAARAAAATVLAAAQGVQLLRTAEPAAAREALRLWQAATGR